MQAATSTAAGAQVVYPGWIIRLDILDDPILVWTGLGPLTPSGTSDAQLNGQTFEGIANVGEISAIVDSREGSQAVKLSLPGVDLQDDALKQVVFDNRRWQFRQAWMWIALFNESGVIQGEPIRVKTGRIDNMEVEFGGETGVVAVNIESHQAYAGDILATRYSEQKEIDSTDISQNFVHSLANQSAVIGQKSATASGSPSTMVSGGGGGGGRGGSQLYDRAVEF